MTHIDNNYYNYHATQLHGQWLKEKSPSDLLPFMELLDKGDRVLDLGCGNGMDLAWLSKAGFEGHGIDSSSEMVSIAKTIHANSGVEIQEKNFLFLNLEESTLDGVWANLTFCELSPEALQRLLAICFKGVKVGGVLGAVLYEGTGSFEEGMEGPHRKVYLYTEKAICSMFEQTGFQVKKIGRKQGVYDQFSKILILAERI